jgi:hypothetical protein
VAGPAAAAQLVNVGQFTEPTFVTAPPGDPHRLFVVEKSGQIELLHDGVRKPFLTVTGVQSAGERGLLSMAVAPDYAKSGRVYVMYTTERAGDPPPDGSAITIAEFRRSATDPDAADPASKRILLSIEHGTDTSHNGGQLQFGPDGYLYASVGDGDTSNDPANYAQNTGVLLGKLLRIDPRQRGTSPYTVPADNPFVGDPAVAPEIYAYGLRNPWRFSFDRLTGDLVIGDVGQSTREEVDYAPRATGAGADFGWHCMEGSIRTPDVSPCGPSGRYVPPVFEFGHSGSGCSGSVMGGYVVRNHDLDSLYGRYVYADFCAPSGDIRSLRLAQPHATDDRSTALALPSVYSFGEDSCGHLYVASATGDVDVVLDDIEVYTACPEPPAPSNPPPKDRTPPKLTLTVPDEERLSPQQAVHVGVRCNEPCTAIASATLALPHAGRAFKLAPVARSLAAGRRLRLVLRVPHNAAEAARRSIRNGHRVRALLKVVARDAAGNATGQRAHARVLP